MTGKVSAEEYLTLAMRRDERLGEKNSVLQQGIRMIMNELEGFIDYVQGSDKKDAVTGVEPTATPKKLVTKKVYKDGKVSIEKVWV